MSSTIWGYVDHVSRSVISGWCGIPGRHNSFSCDLMINNTVFASTLANLHRSDLADHGINDGMHGFSFDISGLDVSALCADGSKAFTIDVHIPELEQTLPSAQYIPFLSQESPKHLTPYLANFLTPDQKIACWNRFNLFFIQHILPSQLNLPIILWEKRGGTGILSLALRYSDFAPREGELSLVFTLNGEDIFFLTFTLAPGEIAGSSEHTVLFIAGMQGRPHIRDQITQATFINDGVHPSTMLLAAARALCKAWNLNELAAVSAAQQISCSTPEQVQFFKHHYEDFWCQHGGKPADTQNQIYLLPLDPPIKTGGKHRQRAARRRAWLSAAAAEINARLPAMAMPAL